MIALCLCNNMTPSQTQPPLNLRETLTFERQGKPRYKNPANLHSSTKHSLYNNPTPLEFNQATPNAYQMIALCLCNNMTPSQTQPPLIWGRHWALKDRGKPRYKNPANLHSSTKHSLYNNPTPLEFNQATPNAYQMIALCLCNNMTPSQTQTSS